MIAPTRRSSVNVRRILATALLLASASIAEAQAPSPPNTFHPYRGGTNCIQVADSLGNFNCAGGTTLDPTTGNMVVSGTLAFAGLAAGTFSNGLALAAVNSGVQLLGAGDLVISTSSGTIAPAGPQIRGVMFRVRQGPAGSCQLVVSGGNSFGQEFIIPVVPASANFITAPTGNFTYLRTTFPGGPSGC